MEMHKYKEKYELSPILYNGIRKMIKHRKLEKQGETLDLSFFTSMVNPCYNSMSRSVYIRLSIESGVKI